MTPNLSARLPAIFAFDAKTKVDYPPARFVHAYGDELSEFEDIAEVISEKSKQCHLPTIFTFLGVFFVINVGFAQAYASVHVILQSKMFILFATYTMKSHKLIIETKSRPDDNTIYFQVFMNEQKAKSFVFKPVDNKDIELLGEQLFYS